MLLVGAGMAADALAVACSGSQKAHTARNETSL